MGVAKSDTDWFERAPVVAKIQALSFFNLKQHGKTSCWFKNVRMGHFPESALQDVHKPTNCALKPYAC